MTSITQNVLEVAKFELKMRSILAIFSMLAKKNGKADLSMLALFMYDLALKNKASNVRFYPESTFDGLKGIVLSFFNRFVTNSNSYALDISASGW